MSVSGSIVRHTLSVCPSCLKRIPAVLVDTGDGIYLQKECPEHGKFSSIIWRSNTNFGEWIGDEPEIAAGENLNCPTGCGLCPDHRQDTCCTLLEVTHRCNLNCRFCFANSEDTEDPSFEQVCGDLRSLAIPGKTLVQLSGGEPTVRDDLPQIVAFAKAAGCRYVQLNTNGIRLAEDEPFLRELVSSGLSFVFMQFDGTSDDTYLELRGRNLLDIKKRALDNCAKHGIGVTLVPMLVPGINTHDIGNILRYGISMSPTVRGVHFQPVSYFGRTPGVPTDDMRYTLDQLLQTIEDQTGGLIRTENLLPSSCNHPLCGFHGDFVVMPGGQDLKPLTARQQRTTGCSCGTQATADQRRAFVARRWNRNHETQPLSCKKCSQDLQDMSYFLSLVKSNGFTVTAMPFQDAGTLDIERLRRCSLHVFAGGKLVPFCAHYLSGWQSK